MKTESNTTNAIQPELNGQYAYGVDWFDSGLSSKEKLEDLQSIWKSQLVKIEERIEREYVAHHPLETSLSLKRSTRSH